MAAQEAVGGAGAEMPRASLPSPDPVAISGGFGTVIKPALPNVVDGIETPFPGNVTKIFFFEKNLESLLSKANIIPAIMNKDEPDGRNAGHNFHKYTKQYTLKNLPKSVQKKIKSIIALKEDAPLPLLRMPNLGIDILSLSYESPPEVINHLRTIPIPDVLAQIYKLVRQTYALHTSGYTHNDIRDLNVIIHPETANMTIIDFDLLNPIKDQDAKLRKHASNIMYHLPPECLMYANLDLVMDSTVPIDLNRFVLSDESGNLSITRKDMYEQYLNLHFYHFKVVNRQLGIYDKDKLNSRVLLSLKNNIKYIRQQISAGNVNVYKKILETSDNFGLAYTLLNMLGKLYPDVVRYGHEVSVVPSSSRRVEIINKAKLLEPSLGILITNNGSPYSALQLKLICVTLLWVSFNLNRACVFEIEVRSTPKLLFETIKIIYDQMVELFYPSTKNTETGSFPVLYPSHAPGAAEDIAAAERVAVVERAAAAAEAERAAAAAAAEAERAAAAAAAERAAAERAGKITAAALGKTTTNQTRRQGRGRLEGLAREYLPKGLANVCFGSHCNTSNNNNNQDGGSKTRRNHFKPRHHTSRQRIFKTRNKRRCARKH